MSPRTSRRSQAKWVSRWPLSTMLPRASGAALAGAIKVAARHDAAVDGPAVIVFVVCDGAWKYLSTGAYTSPLADVVENLGDTIYF